MKILCFIFFVLISFDVKAEEPDLQPESLTPYNLKVGATLQHYRYEEPGLISHTGILIGAWLNWFYPTPFYTGVLQGDLNSGRIEYDGALCNVNTNQCTQYKSKTNELIIRLSHRFQFEVTASFQAFAGLGYRYLFDKGEGSGFYRRVGQYWILPVGFTARLPWTLNDAEISLDAEYGFFLKGQIQSSLSEVNGTYGDVKHTQNQGRSLKLTLGFETPTTADNPRPWLFYFFYENWSISSSDQVELSIGGQASGKFYYEPENHSDAFGLKIGWAY